MRARTLLAGGLFVVACLALPAGAGASLGQLTYVGCQANDASQGCVDVPAAPLSGAFGLAVSPDSGSVYVTSYTSNSISHLFASDPGGRLTFDGCLASDATQGCADLPAAPISDAVGVAASPDGNSVYVASGNTSNSISHFFVSKPGGQLTLDGCLANDATQGCGDLPALPLTGAHGVAVSPDGGSVYVVSTDANSIAHFFRAPQGQLTYDGCLANDASQGCGDLPGLGPLTTPLQVAVSPDGKSVYVITQGGLIVHFTAAAPGGQLTYEGCLDNDGSQGCVDLPGAPLQGGESVAVSPDGGSVYVASYQAASVAHFVVDKAAGGTLTYEGCLANDASQGCVDLPGAPLSGATGVAISPDGSSAYVSSYDSSSVSQFRVAKPGGQLTYDGCLADDASQGCVDLPAAPLGGAGLVAVSPDGGSVYVTGDKGNSIVHFSRDTSTGSGGGGGGGGGAAAKFLSARMSRKVFAVDPKGAPEPLVKSSAKRGTTFAYSLSAAARVVFRIERPARGRKVGRSCRKPSRRNRHGHRCTRYLKVGAFAQEGVAGQNQKAWSGKLGKRGLRPGRYRATLIATSPGTTASKPKHLSFKIVRG
jgi:DNA-binding beta-propeller fold protein YncE